MASKARTNLTVSFNSTAITNYCNQADVSATIDRLDTTHLGSTGKESITGDGEWTISLQGNYASALEAVLGPEAITPGTRRTAVIAFTEGGTTVTLTWTSLAEIQDLTFSGQTGGLLTWSATLMLSGAPSRGTS